MSLKKKVIKTYERYDRLDALRGMAIIWMTLFHFCFDLNYFGFLHENFYENIFWTAQRSCIVSLFLLCAGIAQASASDKNLSWPRFWKRWRQVALAALLVTIGSYAVYPKSFIYFGILHGMAAMLLILRFIAGKAVGRLWLIGLLLIALSFAGPSLAGYYEIFNQPALNWLGLISRKPITEDYVPLIPWIGVLFIGYSLGLWTIKNKKNWLTDSLNKKFNFLSTLGQWSLSYYLIHQPVLFGLVWLAKKLV